MNSRGFCINTNKSETIIINRNESVRKISLGQISLKQVKQFRYFGVTISEDEKRGEELNCRIIP